MDDHDAVGQDPEEHGASAREGTPTPGARRTPVLVAAAAGAGYGWWAVGLDPFSGEATVAVLAGGVAAMAWGRRRPARSHTGTDLRDALAWAVVAAMAAAWQLAAFVQHPREDHPTLSSLTNALLDSHATRAAAFVAWLAAAVGLARR